MYKFTHHKVDWLNVYDAQPELGAKHIKCFALNTAPSGQFALNIDPADQFALNIYLSGESVLEVPSIGFSQTLLAGQSSIDVTLAEYPAGALVIERPSVAPARRLCVSPINPKTKWTRRRVDLCADEAVELGSAIAIVVNGMDALQVVYGVLRADTPLTAYVLDTL